MSCFLKNNLFKLFFSSFVPPFRPNRPVAVAIFPIKPTSFYFLYNPSSANNPPRFFCKTIVFWFFQRPPTELIRQRWHYVGANKYICKCIFFTHKNVVRAHR